MYLGAGKCKMRVVLKENCRSIKFRGIKDSLDVETIAKGSRKREEFIELLLVTFLCQLNQSL